MDRAMLLSLVGAIALLIVSISFAHSWTGQERRKLALKQFDAWCGKAYFGMSDAETDRAERT